MADPLTILTAIGTALGIVDKVADQVERFWKKTPESAPARPHSVVAKQTGDKIEFLDRSGAPVETITADDMRQLDPQSQQLVEAFEKSMRRQFDLWTQIYPERDASSDPLVNAKTNAQLKDIAEKMCGDLDRILSFLEGMGKRLFDHYGNIRFICNGVRSSG